VTTRVCVHHATARVTAPRNLLAATPTAEFVPADLSSATKLTLVHHARTACARIRPVAVEAVVAACTIVVDEVFDVLADVAHLARIQRIGLTVEQADAFDETAFTRAGTLPLDFVARHRAARIARMRRTDATGTLVHAVAEQAVVAARAFIVNELRGARTHVAHLARIERIALTIEQTHAGDEAPVARTCTLTRFLVAGKSPAARVARVRCASAAAAGVRAIAEQSVVAQRPVAITPRGGGPRRVAAPTRVFLVRNPLRVTSTTDQTPLTRRSFIVAAACGEEQRKCGEAGEDTQKAHIDPSDRRSYHR